MATIVNGNERGRPGKWIVDYHDANGVRRWATFRTRAAAKKKLGLVLTQDEPPRSTTTLKELAKTWLPQVKVAVKPATFESYEMMLRRHLLPGLGRQTRVQALKAQPILNLLVRKLQPKGEGGDGLSRNTVRCMHSTLWVMLQRAVKTGLLYRNPALGLGKDLKLEDPLDARRGILKAQPGFDSEQLGRFLSTREASGPYARAALSDPRLYRHAGGRGAGSSVDGRERRAASDSRPADPRASRASRQPEVPQVSSLGRYGAGAGTDAHPPPGDTERAAAPVGLLATARAAHRPAEASHAALAPAYVCVHLVGRRRERAVRPGTAWT
jgi:hypothetical protein